MSLADEPRPFQRGYYRRVEVAFVVALACHVAVFALAPPYVPRPYQLHEPPLRLVSTAEEGTGAARSQAGPLPARPAAAPRAAAVVTEQLRFAPSAQTSPAASASARPDGSGEAASGSGGGLAEVAPPVFYAFDSPPRVTRRVEPEYPTAAKVRGAQGTLVVNVNIDEHGRIMRVWVVQSTAPEILVQAAIDALYQFEFSPGSAHGNPVKCTVAIPFNFRLNRHL